MADEIVRSWTVYGLREHGSECIRYIGQTSSSLQRRLMAHRCESKDGLGPKNEWFREVCRKGGRVEIFQIVSGARLDIDEIDQIDMHRAAGHDLLNVTGGGRGLMRCDDATREKISIAAVDRFKDPAQRKKTSDATKLAMSKDAVKEKMAIAAVERWKDPNNRKKQSDRLIRQFSDPAQRAAQAERRAKLTTDQVIEARRLRRAGAKLEELCKMFGIAMGPMSMLCNGKTFKHVPV